jgi:L-alanine-DL-glutamate epimerase-like enolase superfamily enzyme
LRVQRHLETTIVRYPIAGEFRIARGAKTVAEVVVCTIRDGTHVGRGECVPYKRYGETLESVTTTIDAMAAPIGAGMDHMALQAALPAGAARNAIDCALWDLEAKASGVAVTERLDIVPLPLTTCYTISLGEPEAMAAQTARFAHRDILKIKLGTEDDERRMRAVRAAAPTSILVVDANEGWTSDNLSRHLAVAAECGIALVEQPLPAGADALLADIDHPLLICADESVHATADLAALVGRYDAVNIKLDKTGGLTEALTMKAEATRLGLKIMAGCMVGSSLAMAPAVLLAQGVAFVDLDGPLLLAEDHAPALRYDGSLVYPPETALWG